MAADWVSVTGFGAVGDGVHNDTLAFQRAIDCADSIYVPPGTWLVGDLNLRSNVSMTGAGPSSVLQQSRNAWHVLSANQGARGSPSILGNIRNLALRHLTFHGNVVLDGFKEHSHLVNLNGCSNVLIEDCSFVGFRGDGLYIGSGNAGGIERHNHRVVVRKCWFDGENWNNRNGISVIDCDDLLIEYCTFSRCSRADMPGAIDIEPDPFSFHHIRNITIRSNLIESCRGGIAAICLYLPLASFRLPPENLLIENNVILGERRVYGLSLRGPKTAEGRLPYLNARVHRNYVLDTKRPFNISGVCGVELSDNMFLNSDADGLFGAQRTCEQILMTSNLFSGIGDLYGTSLTIMRASDLVISENQFVSRFSTKAPRGGTPILVMSEANGPIQIFRNSFASEMETVKVAIQVAYQARSSVSVALNRVGLSASEVTYF